jgi:predicted amidohydrolase
LPAEQNVADLFGFLWRQLDAVVGDFIADGWPRDDRAELRRLAASIDHAAPGTIPPALLDRPGLDFTMTPATAPPARLTAEQEQDYLLVAKAIDLWFEQLHPRYASSRSGRSPAQRYYREQRRRTGRYNALDDGTWVVPKPPLRPQATEPPPVVNRLDGQFWFLSLVHFPVGERKIVINTLAHAVDPAPIATVPRIGFVPLAEAPDDLRFEPSHLRDSPVLDVQPANEALIADRAAAAVEAACKSGTHICVLPELCVSPAVADRIQQTLAKFGADSELRLVVAGSGMHKAPDGMSGAYNECHIFDRIGRRLWRQPKINAYAMDHEKMAEYGLNTVADAAHLEKSRPGDTLYIQESAGLGRMMVLICQDLEEVDPGRRAREAFPPDWVFSPILDGSIEPGRWVHQAGFRMASESRCRVIVANSMILHARTAKPGDCAFGLCIDDAKARRIRFVQCPAGPGTSPIVGPIVGYVDWEPDTWSVTKVGV